jgi:hypothetical protein
MNALANSQNEELGKFLEKGYPEGKPPVRFARYTGQEMREDRQAIQSDPPDILLTNYMILELLLTRHEDRELVRSAYDLGGFCLSPRKGSIQSLCCCFHERLLQFSLIRSQKAHGQKAKCVAMPPYHVQSPQKTYRCEGIPERSFRPGVLPLVA